MNTTRKIFIPIIVLLTLLAGCSTPQPLPFQLIDTESKIQKGTIFTDGQRIEVNVDGQLYKGFYIVASGFMHSETFGGWRSMPRNTISSYSSNSARAQLTSEKGQRLKCEFLFESRRAIGECHTPAGVVFQLTSDGN